MLAAGPGAVLSHRSAAALWRIRDHRAAWVEVTTPTRRRSRRGIVVHRSGTLDGDVTVHEGIPVTTVARTLTDLADVVAPTALRRALETAERLRLVDRDDLVPAPGRRPVVREPHRFVRSTAERALDDRWAAHGVPLPETNQAIGRWEVDFLWRAERVVLELDFYETHKGRAAYERDRVKTTWLEDRGYRVIREPGEDLDVAAVCRRVVSRLAATRTSSPA